MAVISFQGLVVAWNPGEKHAEPLVIGCIARLDARTFRVISLEGRFAGQGPTVAPKVGELACGQARILDIWDGSLLVEFLDDGFTTMPAECQTDFAGRPLKYIHAPRAHRQMQLAGKEYYRCRLPEEYNPNQIGRAWTARRHIFGSLAPNLLDKDGKSMALLEGQAIFIKKIRIKGIAELKCYPQALMTNLTARAPGRRKNIKKEMRLALFLLAIDNPEIHTPVLVLAQTDPAARLKRGCIYGFRDLPVLITCDKTVNEDESILVCGKGDFALIDAPAASLLLNLYDELANAEMAPDWLWQKYLGKTMRRTELRSMKSQIESELRSRGVPIPEKVHAWWYYWDPADVLGAGGDNEIIVIGPDFPDGGAPRVVVLPRQLYKLNRRSYPDYAAAVSVSADPQIIEGPFQPDPESWNLIREWIISNRTDLAKGELDTDIYFLIAPTS